MNLDEGDDVYEFPWLCAGEMGDWKLTPSQAKKLRDYLLRGGFLMLDDFWGPEEWNRFNESMSMVFPDRQIVVAAGHAIFHNPACHGEPRFADGLRSEDARFVQCQSRRHVTSHVADHPRLWARRQIS